MPERGWYSLMVRMEASVRVREIAGNRGLTVDELKNMLLKPASKGVWSTCTGCGARVNTGNLVRHMATVHPKTVRVLKCDLTGQIRYKLARAITEQKTIRHFQATSENYENTNANPIIVRTRI